MICIICNYVMKYIYIYRHTIQESCPGQTCLGIGKCIWNTSAFCRFLATLWGYLVAKRIPWWAVPWHVQESSLPVEIKPRCRNGGPSQQQIQQQLCWSPFNSIRKCDDKSDLDRGSPIDIPNSTRLFRQMFGFVWTLGTAVPHSPLVHHNSPT